MALKYRLFFKWHRSGYYIANMYHCFAGKSKLNGLSTLQSKVYKPGSHGVSCQLALYNI